MPNCLGARDIQKYNHYPSFRAGQPEAINGMLDLIEEGQKVITLRVPTAGGKSGDIYTTMMWAVWEMGYEYVTYTSPQVQLVGGQLRAQFGDDLPVLVGKANYKCLAEPNMTAEHCPFKMSEDGFIECEKCPYRLDYRLFMESPYGATTFDRYLSDPNIHGRCQGLFIDESATTEDKLLARVDMFIPNEVDIDDLQRSLALYYHKLAVKATILKDKVDGIKEQIVVYGGGKAIFKHLVEVTTEYNAVEREARKCARCMGYLERRVPYMIDEKRHFRLIEGKVLFQDLIEPLKFVVLASGTPTTDLLTSDYKTVSTPHPIDVSRRLVYFDPWAPGTKNVMKMNYEERATWAPHMALKIAQYHSKYAPGKHTLVHCGTYKVAELIYQGFEAHAFAHHPDVPFSMFDNVVLQASGAAGRDRTMTQWQAGKNTILLAVERNEGISCDGPEYPLNIIANVFYPPYKDPWISARNAFDNKVWYNTNIAVDIVQAASRCTRGPEDFSTSAIFDGKFKYFYAQNRLLFPPYFREALRVVK